MAKKTKELEVEEIKPKKVTKSTAKKSTTKKAVTKKSTTVKKATTAKKSSTAKKASSTVKKKSTTKKEHTKKASTEKKTTIRKKVASKKTFVSEYYDLPYMYDKTVVKVLAQTPKTLFIYWEVSEKEKTSFIKKYGANFFEITKPVLIVYNDTMNYSFEIEINDFANSWYIHVENANCEYHVELGRKPIIQKVNEQTTYIPYYLYLTSSNEMDAPNNKILFDANLKTIKFRNVKNGQTIEKDINQFTFITNFGIFTIQDLYRHLFPNESFEYENIVLGNTSSGALSSSGMFSSQFK